MISILGPLGTLKGPQRTTVNRAADSMAPVSLASELSDLQIGAPLSRESACRWLRCEDELLPRLLSAARQAKERFKPHVITYSRKAIEVSRRQRGLA